MIFQEKRLKDLKCCDFLWVQRRLNCSPAASFANCVWTLYLLKVHLQTLLSIPVTQKMPNFELTLLSQLSDMYCVSTVSPFFFLICRTDGHENKSPATCEMRLAIRFLNSRIVRLAEIYRQRFEVYGVGVVNEGNVRKWCRLFKEGRTTRDQTPPPVQAHYWNSSRGKFSSILYTVPNLFQVRHLFLSFKKFLVGHILRDKRRFAGLSERLGGDLFRRRHKKPGPTTWLVSKCTWRLYGVVV